MKSPSKNISTSLRGQSEMNVRTPTVSSLRRESLMPVPGEGGVSNPPGNPPAATAKRYAKAVGKTFGGGR